MVKATNAQRTAHGLRPMTVTSCLSSLATKWAAHLAATNTFAHQSLGPFLTNCHAIDGRREHRQGQRDRE